MPQKLKEQILEMNKQRSEEFVSTIEERRSYRRNHPTEIAVTQCMDGRVNIRRVTGVPLGIITHFRNIGGIYDVGWPMMQKSLNDWENYAHSKRRPALLIVTYHWSDSNSHFGCRAFDYDKEVAIKRMIKFRNQVESCYRGKIWPVLVGLETDSDGLLIHSAKREIVDLRNVKIETASDFLREKFYAMFADFPKQIIEDMLPLFLGNIEYLRNNKINNQNKFLEHRERVLALGQGFDWLDNDNLALIIGPCEPDLGKTITTAASIIQNNLIEGRITSDDKGVLLVCSPCREFDEKQAAMAQSKYLADFALKCIEKDLPDMKNFFHLLVGVVNLGNRRFEICE